MFANNPHFRKFLSPNKEQKPKANVNIKGFRGLISISNPFLRNYVAPSEANPLFRVTELPLIVEGNKVKLFPTVTVPPEPGKIVTADSDVHWHCALLVKRIQNTKRH